MDTRFLAIVLSYFAIINLFGLFSMFWDKHKAQKGKWRTPEAVFFLVSLLGGGIGTLAGMYAFRHKTKHLSFKAGIPICMIIGLVLVGILFYYLVL